NKHMLSYLFYFSLEFVFPCVYITQFCSGRTIQFHWAVFCVYDDDRLDICATEDNLIRDRESYASLLIYERVKILTHAHPHTHTHTHARAHTHTHTHLGVEHGVSTGLLVLTGWI